MLLLCLLFFVVFQGSVLRVRRPFARGEIEMKLVMLS